MTSIKVVSFVLRNKSYCSNSPTLTDDLRRKQVSSLSPSFSLHLCLSASSLASPSPRLPPLLIVVVQFSGSCCQLEQFISHPETLMKVADLLLSVPQGERLSLKLKLAPRIV